MNYTSVHGLKLLTFDTNSEKVTIVNEKPTGKSPVKCLRKDKNKGDYVDVGHKDNKHLVRETGGTNDQKIFKCNQFSKPCNTQKIHVDNSKRIEDYYCKERYSTFQKQPQGRFTRMPSEARRYRDELIQIDQSGDSNQIYETLNRTNIEIKDSDKPKSEGGDTIIEKSTSQVVDLRKSFQDYFFYRDGKILKQNEKDKSVLGCRKEIRKDVPASKPEKKIPNTLKIRKSSSLRRLPQKKLSFNRLKSNLSLHCNSNNTLIKDSLKSRKSLSNKSDEYATSNQEQKCSSDISKIRHFGRRSISEDWFGFRKSSKTDNQVLFCSRKCQKSKEKNLRASRSFEHNSVIAKSQDKMRCDDAQSCIMLSLPRLSKTCVTKERKILYSKRNENTSHSATRNLSATQSIRRHVECCNPIWSSKNAHRCYILTESLIIVLLRICLVCLILIIWLPYILVVSLYWLITYPMKPNCKKDDKLSASFIKWTNCYNSRVLEVLKSLLKPKESSNDAYQGNCKDIHKYLSHIPDPQRQYILAYSRIRGWLMKPVPQKQKHRSILRSKKCPYKCKEKNADSKKFKRVKCPHNCNQKKIEGHSRLRWSLKNQDAEAGISFQLEKRLQSEPIKKLETVNDNVNKSMCDCPRQKTKYYVRTCPCSPQESRKLLFDDFKCDTSSLHAYGEERSHTAKATRRKHQTLSFFPQESRELLHKNVKCQCSSHPNVEEKCATVIRTVNKSKHNCIPLEPHGEFYSPYHSLRESKKVMSTISRNDCQSRLHLERREKCHSTEPKRKLVNKTTNKSTCYSPTLDAKCETHELISLCSSPQESRKVLYKNVKCDFQPINQKCKDKCLTTESAPKRKCVNQTVNKSICYCPNLDPQGKGHERSSLCSSPQESRKLLYKNVKCECPTSYSQGEEKCRAIYKSALRRNIETGKKSTRYCPTRRPCPYYIPQESRKLLPKNVKCECPPSKAHCQTVNKAVSKITCYCPTLDPQSKYCERSSRCSPQDSRKLLPKNVQCECPPSKAYWEENCPAELAPKRRCQTVNKAVSKITCYCPTLDCERSPRRSPKESRKCLLLRDVTCECPSTNECPKKKSEYYERSSRCSPQDSRKCLLLKDVTCECPSSNECPKKILDPCCTKKSFLNKCYNVCKDNFVAYCKFEEEKFTPRLKCDEIYIQTLRNKPCFCFYRCCPQLYPFLINACRLCQNGCYTMLCACAACLWMPWLCCCFLCSKLFCSCC